VKSPMSGTLTSIVLIATSIGSGVSTRAPAASSLDLSRERASEHPVPDRPRRRHVGDL
jgi:hypothetical protein